LYSLLEAEVVPEFYERDQSGMPSKWLGRIRESMAKLTPEFSATRAIREYTESHYLPAASRYHDRAADDCAVGAGLLRWKQDLERHWNSVRFGTLTIGTHDGQHFFQVEVFPGAFTPDQLRVELYADSIHGGMPAIEAMTASEPCPDLRGTLTYSADVSALRAAGDYTARVVPYHLNASVPLEAEQIVWQH
jgi:starch phosphorylase